MLSSEVHLILGGYDVGLPAWEGGTTPLPVALLVTVSIGWWSGAAPARVPWLTTLVAGHQRFLRKGGTPIDPCCGRD